MKYRFKQSFIIVFLQFMILLSANASNSDANQSRAKFVCGACHGRTGVSVQAAMPSLAGLDKAYLLKQLRDYKSGERSSYAMKAQLRNTSDEDLADFAAYFASQPAPEPDMDMTEAEVADAKKLYNQGIDALEGKSCSTCHGADGTGSAYAPRLAGQQSFYMARQLEKYQRAALQEADETQQFSDAEKRLNGDGAAMKIASKDLSEGDIDLLTRYIQGL